MGSADAESSSAPPELRSLSPRPLNSIRAPKLHIDRKFLDFNLIINSISDNDLPACVVFMEIRTEIVVERECIDVSGIYLGAVFTSTTSALWVFSIGTSFEKEISISLHARIFRLNDTPWSSCA